MKVIINRNMCGHHPASCEKCFGEFLRRGDVPDRGCIVDVQDDGQKDLTAIVTSGKYTGTLVVNDQNREEVIYDGYIKFMDLPAEAFEIVPPHGEDIRRMLREQAQN